MPIWSNVTDMLVMLLVTLSQAFGGSLGLAIITLSCIVRVALLPVTLRLARRARIRRAQLQALEPEIAQLRRRYRSNPERLAKELTELYARNGYNPVDTAGLLGGLVQLPAFAGLYSAVSRAVSGGGQFLWIGNLAQPDLLVTALVAGLTFVAGSLNPDVPPASRLLVAALPALITALFLWQMASGLGLYWATSSVVNIAESWVLARRTK